MVASILAAAAAIYLAIALTVIGSRRPSYSQARHTISELGEYGSPDQQLVALGVFLPIGLALLLAAFVVQPQSAPSAGLALCIGIGYIVAAAFPCDPGSPSSGSTRQTLHNLGGGIEYFGGAYALLRLSESFGAPFRVAGFFVAAAAIIISVPAVGRIRGIVQRFAEACLFAALVWCTWVFGVGA